MRSAGTKELHHHACQPAHHVILRSAARKDLHFRRSRKRIGDAKNPALRRVLFSVFVPVETRHNRRRQQHRHKHKSNHQIAHRRRPPENQLKPVIPAFLNLVVFHTAPGKRGHHSRTNHHTDECQSDKKVVHTFRLLGNQPQTSAAVTPGCVLQSPPDTSQLLREYVSNLTCKQQKTMHLTTKVMP